MYSVIIPVYNEEESITDTVNRVKKAMANFDHEIICINDCSKDSSGKILDSIEGIKVFHNETNKGYGGALKRGFKLAKGDWFIITDADGTYPVEDMPKLIDNSKGQDMVIGSRTGEKVYVPLAKKIAKEILKLFALFVTGEKIPDLNSGLRLFKKELAERFYDLFPNGFSLTTTITVSSILNNYKVKFIPINYFKRKWQSSITPKDFFRFVKLITKLAIKFRPHSLKEWIQHIKKLQKNHFVKYLTIGVIMTIITTAIMWFFVDIVGLLAVVVSPIMTAAVFFIKYFLYHQVSMFENNKRIFTLYISIWFILLGISTSFLWFTVDFLKLPVIIMNPAIVIITFLLRFYFYKIFKMLKKQEVL